jgi:hypothetical protein
MTIARMPATTPAEPIEPEILALARALARRLAREHHEAEQRQGGQGTNEDPH